MKKRLFSLLLALVLVLSLFPALSQQTLAAAVYPLWVGGVQVNSANQNDILGDGGSARFDSASNTLWLMDAKISSVYDDGSRSYLIYADNMDLTVRGSGSLTGRASRGIQVRGGSLTVDADLTIDFWTDTDHVAASAYALIASGDVLILGGDLDLRVYGSAISAGNITISGGSLTAATGNILLSAIEATGTFTVTNGVNYLDVTVPEDSRYGAIKSGDSSFSIGDALAVTVPENARYGQWIMESDGTTKARHVVIVPVYELWVGGVQVNGANRNDILGDGGSARFDPAESTLWLTDAKISSVYDDGSKSYLIYADNMDLTVRGSGSLTGRACAGIQVQNGSLTVNADLTINNLLNDINYWTVGSYGLVSSEDILILGGNLNVTRVTSNPIRARNVTISGGSLTVDMQVSSTYDAIEVDGSFTVTNDVYYIDVIGTIKSGDSSFSIGDALTVTAPENAQYGQWIMESDGTTKARHVVITRTYDLWVGGVQVTGRNKDDILSDGGKAKYDPDNQVLTLNNPAITGYHSGPDGASASIFSRMPAVILKGSAEIDGTGQFATVYAGYDPGSLSSCELVLKGDFTIKNDDGISVFSTGDVTVTEGNLSCGIIRSFEGSVNITGGTVTASQGIEGELGVFVGSGARKVDATASFGSALNAPNGMITLGEGLIIAVPDPASSHDGRIYATDGVTETEAGHVVIVNPEAFPLEITQQPQDASGKLGDQVKFTVAATGENLTYQWQLSKDNGETWTMSSSTTAVATCTLSSASRDGWLYRCIIFDSFGHILISDTARVTVLPGPVITTQPKNASGKLGDVLKFTVAATGTGLKYQWYLSKDNGKTWTKSSSTSATATCTLVSAERNGWLYRCVITDASGVSVTSNTAKVIVLSGPVITMQPKDASSKLGDVLKFTVAATGTGLKYQWYLSKDNGKTWTKSSSTSATATCTLVSAERSGWLYRCVITDASGNSVTSSTAKVIVVSGPVITQQPKNASGKVGDVLKFTVAAAGEGLTYQWQYSKDGGKTWTKSSSTSATATCTLTSAARDGWLYRCIITDANGKTVTTNNAVIVVLPAITQQPKDAEGSVGQKVTFTVAATGCDLTYQWQLSKDGGKTWTKSSSTSATATCTLVSAERSGWLYRCVVTDVHGTTAVSDTARVIVH